MANDWTDVSDELKDDFEDVSDELKSDNSFSPETALRSYGNAALLGYGDNIRAATEPFAFKVLNAITGQDVESEGDYIQRRDEEIKRTKKLQEENPVSSAIGTGAGIAASAIVPATSFVKGATTTAKVANAAITGGAMGALQNPGEKEGEFSGFQGEDRLKNAALGAGLGAGFTIGGQAIAKGMEKAPKIFRDFGAEKAVKAAGAMKKDMKALAEKDQLIPLGQKLLDDEIVTPLARPKDISERIGKKIGETSQKLESEIANADQVLWRPEGFNMENATPEQIKAFQSAFVPTSQIKDQLIQDFRKGFDGVPEEELLPAINKIEAWFKDRPEHMSVGEFQKMKTGLNNFLKKSDFYRDMPGIGKEGLLAVRRGAKEAIENKANAAAEIMGEQGGKIKSINKDFGHYLEAQDLADDAIGREASNRMISLTDTIAGAAGLPLGGIPGAVATAAANKAARTYANPLMATGANFVGKKADAFNKFIQSSPKMQELFKRSPAAAAAMFQGVLARTNQTFEDNPNPYQPQFQEDRVLRTIGSDPNNLNHIQNPKLRNQVEQMQREKFKREVSPQDAQQEFINGN